MLRSQRLRIPKQSKNPTQELHLSDALSKLLVVEFTAVVGVLRFLF